MNTLLIIYLALSCAFFLALPPYSFCGQTNWVELMTQLIMSLLWPFFLTVFIFRKIIDS